MNTQHFHEWLAFFLTYANPGDVLIMDNLNVHRNPSVLKRLHQNGIKVRFLPTYSSCFVSPLDNSLFHALKSGLRGKEFGSWAEKTVGVCEVWDRIPERMVVRFWMKCGFFGDELEIPHQN